MTPAFFVSDLHGRVGRYEKLLKAVEHERPSALFLGGDLLPSGWAGMAGGSPAPSDFVSEYLIPALERVRENLGPAYPEIFVILGNDDPRSEEAGLLLGEEKGLWHYAHQRQLVWGEYTVFGYACVPPTPFLLKDWERYDVSRFVDPGCVSLEEGYRSIAAEESDIRYGTIKKDLDHLTAGEDLSRAVFLFHAPPYQTVLDRAALDGKMVDHVPLDVHIGSIAIRRFIETRQPLLTLHGHVHEAFHLTGRFVERLGDTVMLGAAHHGPELALVRFDPASPQTATRNLIIT